MTPDEIEAQTWKYGPGIIMVLSLRAGGWAVFNHKRELIEIVHGNDSIELGDEWSRLFRYTEPPPSYPTPRTAADLDSIFKDML